MGPDILSYDRKGTFISTECLDMYLVLGVLVLKICNVPPKYGCNCIKSFFKSIVISLDPLQCYGDVPLKIRSF